MKIPLDVATTLGLFADLRSYETCYVVSLPQASGLAMVSLLPHPASFGFHLTMASLTLGFIFPANRWIQGLHQKETFAGNT